MQMCIGLSFAQFKVRKPCSRLVRRYGVASKAVTSRGCQLAVMSVEWLTLYPFGRGEVSFLAGGTTGGKSLVDGRKSEATSSMKVYPISRKNYCSFLRRCLQHDPLVHCVVGVNMDQD